MSVRVLIVEDSPTQAARLKHVLGAMGFDVSVASRAKEAIAMTKKELPDILVSDVNMPEMDGYELCRAIRADHTVSNIPILLLTGMSDPEDIVLGLDAGADSYLTKPYEESELANRINFVMSNVVANRVASNPIEVNFLGKKHTISASREQMLGLLLSTYESAAQQNRRLNREQLNLKMVQREQDRKLRALELGLTTAQETMEQLIYSCHEPIIIVDESGAFVAANITATGAFGPNAKEFFEKRVGESPKTWNGQEVRWKSDNGGKGSGTIQVLDVTWSGKQSLLLRLQDIER